MNVQLQRTNVCEALESKHKCSTSESHHVCETLESDYIFSTIDIQNVCADPASICVQFQRISRRILASELE